MDPIDAPSTPPLFPSKDTKEDLENVVKQTDPHMLLRISGSLNRTKTLVELSSMDVPQLQNKLFSEFGVRSLTGRTKTELIREVQYEKRLAGQPWYVTYLPQELLVLMMTFLDYTDLLRVAQTCYHWNYISSDDSLWKTVAIRNSTLLMPRFASIKYWIGPSTPPTESSNVASSSSSSKPPKPKKLTSGLKNDAIISATSPDTSVFPSYKARARDLFECCCYYCKNYSPQKHDTLKIRICSKCRRKSGITRRNNAKYTYHLENRDLLGIEKRGYNYYRTEDVEDKAAEVFGSLAICLDPQRWPAKREEIERTFERRRLLKNELKKYGLNIDDILEADENEEHNHPHYEVCQSFLLNSTPEISHLIDLITKSEAVTRRAELLEEIRKLNQQVDTSALGDYTSETLFERYVLRGGDVAEVAHKLWVTKVFEHRKGLLEAALAAANVIVNVNPRTCKAFNEYLNGKINNAPQEIVDAYLAETAEKRKALEEAKIQRQQALLEQKEKDKQRRAELKEAKQKEKEEKARLALEKKEAKEREKAEKLRQAGESSTTTTTTTEANGDVNNNNNAATDNGEYSSAKKGKGKRKAAETNTTTTVTDPKAKGKGKRKVEDSEEEEEEEKPEKTEKGKKKEKEKKEGKESK
eukprot:TRINITY_DN4890_c0_g1_i1.p1 TRINITY_DN4890_c0_g1~~TRINITY_DN4890_c0_g1_i1.p1  ORF type:complete len:640 (-),score=189.67 TRINITY_DN4890_c0_g1_i1:58-1977(-)